MKFHVRSRTFVLFAMGKFYNGTLLAKSTFYSVETESMYIYLQKLVLLRGLPSLDGNTNLLVQKRGKHSQPSLGQADHRLGTDL